MHTLLTQSILDSLKEEKLAAKIDRLDDKKKKKKKKKETNETTVSPNNPHPLVEHVPVLPGMDESLSKEILKEIDSMNLGGKPEKVHTLWISPSSENYCFGNVVNKPHPINNFPSISKLMGLINDLPSTTSNMNACLVTKYETQQAKLSLHKDDEDIISQTSSICTYSIGAPRSLEFVLDTTKIAHRSTRSRPAPEQIKADFILPATNGTMNIMKPGAQQIMRHRIAPGVTTSDETCWRYSLSFRKLTSPSSSSSSPIISSPTSNSPNKASPKAPISDSQHHQKSIILIAGDSFAARLDADRLSRGKETVTNIAKGGLKISAIQKTIEAFSTKNPLVQVKKLFLSFGANDIRYCTQGVNHLKTPVSDLMKTAKTLYPNARVFVQAIPPVHPNGQEKIPSNVCAMNNLIFDRCSRHKLFYLDVFWAFIDRSGNRNERLFPKCDYKGFYDIHPSPKAGMPVLAKFYLRIIHSKWFNPMGY